MEHLPTQTPPANGYIVTPVHHEDEHSKHWKRIILICSCIMLFVSLNIGAFVLATKKKASHETEKPLPPTELVGKYSPPVAIVKPSESETEKWQTYKNTIFSFQYPPDWKSQADSSVENGVKLFNPKNVTGIISASSSATQYVIISHHLASESAQSYVDKIQLNCCIGPSAVPGAAARFKKQSLTINGFDAVGYNPVTDVFAGWNYVFSDKKYIIEAFTTAPTSTGNSIENRIISTFTFIK